MQSVIYWKERWNYNCLQSVSTIEMGKVSSDLVLVQ